MVISPTMVALCVALALAFDRDELLMSMSTAAGTGRWIVAIKKEERQMNASFNIIIKTLDKTTP
jgi:hypothetical protein